MDITLTDATLNLSTNYRSNGSDAAAVGYGDIVYKPEQLVADPSIATVSYTHLVENVQKERCRQSTERHSLSGTIRI